MSFASEAAIRIPVVITGLVPVIHSFFLLETKTWMAGTGERKRRGSSNGYARS
jgi:hypothetical protein